MTTEEMRDRIQRMQIEATPANIDRLATFCYELAGMVDALDARLAAMDKTLKNLCERQI